MPKHIDTFIILLIVFTKISNYTKTFSQFTDHYALGEIIDCDFY